MNANNLRKILKKVRACRHNSIGILFEGDRREFLPDCTLEVADGCLVMGGIAYIPIIRILAIYREACEICDKEE